MKKVTVTKQTFGILGTHLIMSLFLVFFLPNLIGLTENYPTIQIIISLIAVFFYTRSVFISAYNVAERDYKSYSTTKPFAAKGFVISSGIVICIILGRIFHIMAWEFAPLLSSDSTAGMLVISANLIYSFLTSPFWCFVNVHGSEANLWGQIATIAVPIIACVVGYYLGYIKLDYVKFFNKFVYDKTDKK